MTLSALRPGNFHQLRNYLGNSSAKFLQFHTGVIHGKVVGARRWNLLPLATKLEGWYQKIHNTNFNLNNRNRTIGSASNINNSDLHGYKSIHCNNVQETISGNKIIDRPAVLLVFDIETTGLSRNKDRIIEIAIRDLIGGKNSTFETLINPGIHVANEDVHGISSCMVNRPDVPRFEEVIPILLQYVKSRQVDGKPVLLFAHSGRKFDVPFIIREFERCSMKVPDDWLFVDTLPIARQLLNPDGNAVWNLFLSRCVAHHFMGIEDDKGNRVPPAAPTDTKGMHPRSRIFSGWSLLSERETPLVPKDTKGMHPRSRGFSGWVLLSDRGSPPVLFP